MTTLLNFSYPEDYLGELTACYQRYKQLKYHRLTHVRVLTAQGEYSRNLGNTCIGSPLTQYTGRFLDITTLIRYDAHLIYHTYYMSWGDMTLPQLLRGRNCTDPVLQLLDSDLDCTLPGALYEQLSRRGAPHWYPPTPPIIDTTS